MRHTKYVIIIENVPKSICKIYYIRINLQILVAPSKNITKCISLHSMRKYAASVINFFTSLALPLFSRKRFGKTNLISANVV